MKIAFDAKRAFLNRSGLGNYSRALINAVSKYYPQHQYTLFTPKKDNSTYTPPSVNNIITPDSTIGKISDSIWRSYGITSQIESNGIEVYHGLSNELPLNIQRVKAKKIVTIHDIIFLRYPKLYPAIDRFFYTRKTTPACRNADKIIAISKQTQTDLIEFLKVEKSKIDIISPIIDNRFYSKINIEEQKQLQIKYNLPTDFLLYVGTIEERKNLLTILKAINTEKINIPLVVAGKKRTTYFKQIENYINNNKLSKKIIFIENITNEDIPVLYKLATLFIYPSLFEGFGMPVVEAQAVGTPVITSNTSSLPEAAGQHSTLIDPLNEEMLQNAIINLMNDTEKRNKVSELGKIHALNFSEQNTAQRLMKIYE